jgi:hypothetical protein
MYLQDLINDAIEVVLSQDVPEEAFGEAVQAQAALMAGVASD